jgi:hypothetical protein
MSIVPEKDPVTYTLPVASNALAPTRSTPLAGLLNIKAHSGNCAFTWFVSNHNMPNIIDKSFFIL